MSEASDSAHVRIVLADYAVADVGGKITMVGGNLGIIGINPPTGATAPFTVVAMVSFDPKHAGESPAIELSLETEGGQLVTLPSDRLDAPSLQGANVPTQAVRPKKQILMQFQNGLPLAAGTGYRWRIKIDQNSHPEWTELFYVPTASPGPVFH
jgi:hypothetical protein